MESVAACPTLVRPRPPRALSAISSPSKADRLTTAVGGEVEGTEPRDVVRTGAHVAARGMAHPSTTPQTPRGASLDRSRRRPGKVKHVEEELRLQIAAGV